jgi:carbonic anhydrase
MMLKNLPVDNQGDILPEYHGTPVGDLIEYHNLGKPFENYLQAQLLIGMCMDHRKQLRIPTNFAYTLRTGGANLQRLEFKVSFAVAIAGVRAICLIGHDQCSMVGLSSKQEDFIKGLVENGGWDQREAEEHFKAYAAQFEIGDPVEFVWYEARRLGKRYPKLMVAPLFYSMENGLLNQISE